MKRQENVPREDRPDETQPQEKTPYFSTKQGRVWSALALIVIVLVVVSLSAGGAVSFEMDQRMLAVAGVDQNPVFIPYGTIASVETVTALKMDETIQSFDWDSGWCGTYWNDSHGEFKLYAFSKPGLFIVVRYDEGTLIFNGKTYSATVKAYEKLLSLITP